MLRDSFLQSTVLKKDPKLRIGQLLKQRKPEKTKAVTTAKSPHPEHKTSVDKYMVH